MAEARLAARPIRRADRARQVADVLRHQIHCGAYDDGLPGEPELAAEFAVSRNIIREALAALKAEGLIQRGPRIGTHVAQHKYDHDLHALLGLQETFNGQRVRNEVRVATTVSAPPSVARKLSLEAGAHVVFIERLRYLGDVPLSLDQTYLAPDIGAAVLAHPLGPTMSSRCSSGSAGSRWAPPAWRWRRFRPTRTRRRSCKFPAARRC